MPIMAILEGKPNLVEDRMRTYAKSYYNRPDQEEKIADMVKPLDSKEAKQLFKHLIE